MNETVGVAEVLRVMEDKSGHYGWTQGTGARHREDGGEDRCLLMALDRADVELYGNSSHYQSMYFHLHHRVKMSPVRWNDEIWRTKQQVIDLLESTAKDLRNQA